MVDSCAKRIDHMMMIVNVCAQYIVQTTPNAIWKIDSVEHEHEPEHERDQMNEFK